jgi:hypothetical protein
MSPATYVAFVPKAKRDKLRSTLQSEDTGPVVWREARTRQGSEFYFTGPAALVRAAHAYVMQWVATP